MQPHINKWPIITSLPPSTKAPLFQPWSYDVNAIDPDGDTITCSLTKALQGMTIDPSPGIISFTPPHQSSRNAVVVRATDTKGDYREQQFTLIIGVKDGLQPKTA